MPFAPARNGEQGEQQADEGGGEYDAKACGSQFVSQFVLTITAYVAGIVILGTPQAGVPGYSEQCTATKFQRVMDLVQYAFVIDDVLDNIERLPIRSNSSMNGICCASIWNRSALGTRCAAKESPSRKISLPLMRNCGKSCAMPRNT